jgi:anionic cell wall polymer biosynthesis LytR-Cps2A-Psr (LCP) family protein
MIKDDFGVTIDGNVEVDFDGFIAVMDLIAPLDIELTDPEAWYLNEGTDWMLRTGVNSLNGKQLLRYARMRHVGNGDFERTERQRKVLNKAFAKAKGMSVAQLTELANAALPCVTTDLTNAEILKYVYMVGANRMSIGGNFRLPAEGTYYPTMIRGMSVLVPDLAKNSELVREYLYE